MSSYFTGMVESAQFPTFAMVAIRQVFISWTQQWNLDEYVEHYMRSRRLKANDATRMSLLRCMSSYTGPVPYRKSDLDFFLDANYSRR